MAAVNPHALPTGAKPSDVGIGSLINGIFLAIALGDLSADTWARQALTERASFLSAYYTFREEAPIIIHILMFLMLLLPFALWGMVKGHVWPLLRGEATRSNVVGTLNLAAIVAMVSFMVAAVKPAEEALMAAVKAGEGVEAVSRASHRVWLLHAAAVIANVFMCFFPFQTAAAAVHDAAVAKAR